MCPSVKLGALLEIRRSWVLESRSDHLLLSLSVVPSSFHVY